MKFNALFEKVADFRTADRAVSPVIAVILMVAITVILAAVIGTFVLGIGSEQKEAPSAAFDYTYDESTGLLTVSHIGGDNFDPANSMDLKVETKGQTGTWALDVESGSQFTVGPAGSGADLEVAGPFVAGDEVRVIWTSPDGKRSNTASNFQFA